MLQAMPQANCTNKQVFHPQNGTGSVVDIIQRSDKTIIEVAFQNGERRKYNQKNAAKLEIEDQSVILVGSRVQVGGHEGVVVQIHPIKGFKLSKFEDEHHDQWIDHRSKSNDILQMTTSVYGVIETHSIYNHQYLIGFKTSNYWTSSSKLTLLNKYISRSTDQIGHR